MLSIILAVENLGVPVWVFVLIALLVLLVLAIGGGNGSSGQATGSDIFKSVRRDR